MSTLFISDLHLSPAHPELLKLTIDFLADIPKQVDSIYILGDVFNTWLGDDIVPVEFSPLINQLQQLKQRGITSYLMVGNRDFMMGKSFAKQADCILLDDEVVIDLYGTPTLILHGDSLCIDDVAYQRYRKRTRNKLLQWCFLRLPRKYRQAISDKIKQKSREQKQFKSSMIMDVNQAEVIRVMEKYQVTRLIHGHTHRPAFHHIKLTDKPAQRIVLGDWENKVSYLLCDDHQIELIDHRISKSESILKV